MKTIKILIMGAAITLSPLYAQQPQPTVKRHPGDHLHYIVNLFEGEIDKVINVQVHLKTDAMPRPDQNGTTQFGGNCQKTSDPKVWTCDVVIPSNLGLVDGDYRLFQVSVGSPVFGQSYTEEFHVPGVPIQNPDTFKPPAKVSVTESH